jgi:hypothetical protein
VKREITPAQVLTWMLALVVSVAALYWAFRLSLADHEQRAAVFAAGGLGLVVWAAYHLTD